MLRGSMSGPVDERAAVPVVCAQSRRTCLNEFIENHKIEMRKRYWRTWLGNPMMGGDATEFVRAGPGTWAEIWK